MKTATKTFPLRVLLTVTTGRLLTEPKEGGNGIGDLYEILGWMTNDSPFTHQLGRFAEECKPWLLTWFPELEEAGSAKNIARLDELIENAKQRAESPIVAIEMWLKWMAEPGTCNLKASYDVPRLRHVDHAPKDPIAELVEMVGDTKKIVAVEIP